MVPYPKPEIVGFKPVDFVSKVEDAFLLVKVLVEIDIFNKLPLHPFVAINCPCTFLLQLTAHAPFYCN